MEKPPGISIDGLSGAWIEGPMQAENQLARQSAMSGRCPRLLITFFCWALVVLAMPAMNVWLVCGGPAFEEVFSGSFLAVFWSVLAAVLLRKRAGMWAVVLVQLLVLVVSLEVSSGLMPVEVSKIDSDGQGLMNAIMHGGEMLIVIFTGGIMKLTWCRLD
ncbi:MAG: hypothetical protein EOP84_16075 [Verrucomicrobiaceae bacterium]|nr:MAG: hypothetical protein EOP84_16075 [Verrucomicrobiaceae bacterium]